MRQPEPCSRVTCTVALLFLFFLVLACPTLAERPLSWEQTNGPFGGNIHALVTDPADPLYVLAGADSGLYRTQDGGVSWEPMAIDGLDCPTVTQLVFAPLSPLTVYATTSQGAYWSLDRGQTWQVLGKDLPVSSDCLLAVAPQGDVIYMARAGFLNRLVIQGPSWSSAEAYPTPASLRALAVDPKDSALIYAGTSEGAFVSQNRGESWRPILGLPRGAVVGALAIVPTDSRIYAATDEGLYVSMNKGQNWLLLSAEPADLLVIDSSVPDHIYANLGLRGVFQSEDGGLTWSALYYPARLGRVWAMAMPGLDRARVYLGTDRGLHLTLDGGLTWQASNNGLISSAVEQILDVPGDRGHLYALSNRDVFVTIDGGEHWALASTSADAPELMRLAIDTRGKILYGLGSVGTLWRSQDEGRNWSELPRPDLEGTVESLHVLERGARDPTTLIVDTGGALWASLNDGQVWASIGSDLPTKEPGIMASYRGTVYLALGSHIYQSSRFKTPEEMTWECITDRPFSGAITELSISLQRGPRLYAITDQGAIDVYRIRNSQWENLGTENLPREIGPWSIGLTKRPLGPATLCLLTEDGILCTEDQGETWLVGEGGCLGHGQADCLAVDDRDTQTMYVGTTQRGVYRGTLNRLDAVTWLVYGGLALIGFFLILAFRFVASWLLRRREQGDLLDVNWIQWESYIEQMLRTEHRVDIDMLEKIPAAARLVAMRRFLDSHSELTIKLVDDPRTAIEPVRQRALQAFADSWGAMRERLQVSEAAHTYALRLTEQLCDLLGFTPIESRPYQFLQGYMLQAPTMRLGIPPLFPIIFPLKTNVTQEDMRLVRDLMRAMNATSFFAIIAIDSVSGDSKDSEDRVKRIVKHNAEDFIVVDYHDLCNLYLMADPVRELMKLILDQVDLESVSPYVISGPVPDNMFFGRDYEIKAIMRTIRDRSFAIVGGRKIGKTSILNKVRRLLEQTVGFAPIYLDCQPIANYETFFQALESMEHVYAGPHTPDYLRRIIVHLRQRYHGSSIVFLLDEVDELLNYDIAHQTQLFKVFRALSQEGVCRFVFCGERRLNEALHDPTSPLFNFCSDMRLEHLLAPDTRRIIQEPMAEMSIDFQDPELLPQRIVDLSSCHPNLVQVICTMLIKSLNETGERIITAADLDRVRRSQSFRDYFLDITWGNTTELEKLITVLAVEAQGGTSEEIAHLLAMAGCSVGSQELAQALDALLLLNVFKREESRYVFAARYFPKVMRSSGFAESLKEPFVEQYLEARNGSGERLSTHRAGGRAL